MTLKTKVLLPPLIAILAGLLGAVLLAGKLEKLEHHIYYKLVTDKRDQIQSAIDFAAQQALEKTALFTHLPAVLEAFETAHQGNIDDENDAQGQAAREALRTALKPILDGYSNILSEKFKLHYHLPNGHSLVRLWRDQQSKRDGVWKDISDDVSEFRNTVLDVNQSGKPIKGIELGRDGFVIRGLAPVISAGSKPLGSVEVLLDFKPVLNNVVNSVQNRQGLWLFMNAEELTITTRLRDSTRYPVLADKFVTVHNTGLQQGQDFITADLLEIGRNDVYMQEFNKFVVGVFPVRDYKARQIGVMAYVFDVHEESGLLEAAVLNLALGLFGLLSVLAVVIYLMTKRFVLTPTQRLFDFLQQVKQGDNRVELVADSRDEIGALSNSVNHLVQTQRHVLNQIHRAGVQVTSSATELAATAKQHKATIFSQVESTDKVVASVEGITDVTDDLLGTVEQVAAMSAETAQFATSGQDDLNHMREAMEQMEVASKSISSKLGAINEKNENITGVVTTITKVAEQTNLLSLNAAIEAEKAGEYGHGFNVVAREIRRLADQTAVATLDIDRMVKEMQSAVSAGVMEMDKFISVVRHSAEDVGKISGQLTRIIEQVQTLTPNFESVKVAMEQQSSHAKQISHEIVGLGEGMRQTSETLQESFLAIEQLNEAARGLQNEVERFKTAGLENMEGGKGG